MRSSRGMGCIKKGATGKFAKKPVALKEGGTVKKPGLWANINARKKKGISRPKSKSTITPKAYAKMKAGFPKKGKA